MEMKNGQKNWYIPCIYYDIVKEMDTNKVSISFYYSMPSALYTSSGRSSGFDAADSTSSSSVSLGRSPTIRADRSFSSIIQDDFLCI